MAMTEETLVQEVTADYLLNELKWNQSVMGMQERLGKEGDLGRTSEREVVLTRYLGEKLVELNPGLPQVAYQEALRIVTEIPATANILAVNREKYAVHQHQRISCNHRFPGFAPELSQEVQIHFFDVAVVTIKKFLFDSGY